MRRYWAALVFFIACAGIYNQQVRAWFPHGFVPVATCGPSTDANGWTVFDTTPTTGHTYYISTSDGNDANDGLSSVPNPTHSGAGAGPWQHVDNSQVETKAQADSGKDTHILLRKGDIFPAAFQTAGWFVSGKDCTHPMVFGSYDPNNATPSTVDPYGNFSVSSIACSGTTVTITTSTNHGLTNGNTYQVVLTQSLPAEFNGQFAATVNAANQLQYTVASCAHASASTVGIMALDRPTLEPPYTGSVRPCLPELDGTSGGQYIAFVGLRCYAPVQDPENAAYNPLSVMHPIEGADIENVPNGKGILFEDMAFNSMLGQGTLIEAPDVGETLSYINLRRNVSYKTFGSYMVGIQGLSIYENYNFYNNWNPNVIAGVSITAATGSPGVFTWTGTTYPFPLFNDGSGNCSTVQFTGSSLPTGITAGTTYYVVGVSSNTFSVVTSNTCTGTGITLSDTGSSVVAYWEGSQGAGYAGQYPQPNINLHDYYLANYDDTPPIYPLTMTGDVSGFGLNACQCAGVQYEELSFQSPNAKAIGKNGDAPNNHTNKISYSGIFENAPFYDTPTLASYQNPGGIGGYQNGGTGTTIYDHNIIANAAPPAPLSGSTGITPLQNYMAGTQTVSNNILCNLKTPILNTMGSPIALILTNPGSTYTPNPGTGYYQTTKNYVGVPLTGSATGSGASGTIWVNGTTGQVTQFAAYTTRGSGYQVNDVLTSANTDIGGTGSGWALTVNTLYNPPTNGIYTWTITNGGSGYNAPYGVPTTGGSSGSSGLYVTIAVGPTGAVTYAQPIGGYGVGYHVGDLLSSSNSGMGGTGSGWQGSVSSIVDTSMITFTNNTYRAADCTAAGLNGGGDQPNAYLFANSVAPPLHLSSNPPTDVIGSYFRSLPYGYQDTVPSTLVGQTSDWEQGFIKAASLQQKANWDTNLTAHAVLNWARPQFGMANPY